MDPKYANLPWIASDDKDVYESADLPESDQTHQPMVDVSSAVEVINVKADDALKRFAGKELNPEGADFSDTIHPFRRMGYTSGKEHFEMLSEDERNRESPSQTFQRLQSEILQLNQRLKEAKQEVADPTNAAVVTPEQMSALSESLQESVRELELLSVLQTEKGVHMLSSGGVMHKHLLSHIEGYKDANKKGKAKKPTGEGSSDACVYQLHYHGEAQKSALATKHAALEQRIERVEALLGNAPNKVSLLTADTMSHGLLEGVHKICARSSLLSTSHLDQVETRFNTLHQRLLAITEKKDALTQADTQNKIAELYALVKKWESLCASLPSVVDRLTALKRLHEQAAQFSQTLTFMDKSQKQLDATIKSNAQLLEQLKTHMDQAMEQVKKCTEQLEKAQK